MMRKIVKQILMLMLALVLFCVPEVTANAAQIEDETEEAGETADSPLNFEIAIFTYEIETDAAQEDMPKGFTLGDWEYHGVAVKAGFNDHSDMVCVVAEDVETGYTYRFIHDPEHDLFVPYFGADIKDGYIYTIPMYEEAEVPYGFVESYFVIQTVPMFTYMREDAELTQEEIAVGSLSEDNYLVFLMMNEEGEEVHYTYDLVDRTFQRALLQKKDAEKVTELNETIDELSKDIGELNAINAERMNRRLTVIGVLVAAVIVMAGIIVNLLMKISRMKNGEEEFEEDEEEEEDVNGYGEDVNHNENTEETPVRKIVKEAVVEKKEIVHPVHSDLNNIEDEEEDEMEILDLDEEDL